MQKTAGKMVSLYSIDHNLDSNENGQIKLSHSIHMLNIQIGTKSIELCSSTT